MSAGPRGASINVGKSGVRATASLPGTGLSYSEKLTSDSSLEGSSSSNDIPTGQAMTLIAIGIGVVAMLTRDPLAVAAGWMLTFVALVIMLKGSSWIVRLGGGLTLSLVAMVAVLSWGAK